MSDMDDALQGPGRGSDCSLTWFRIAGAEATKALAVAARWLPEPDAPDSRRTTESDAGHEAAADDREADSGAGSAAAEGAEENPLANSEDDAAEGALPGRRRDLHAAEANGDATPSGNFETMTFHVGGELGLLVQNTKEYFCIEGNPPSPGGAELGMALGS